MKTAIALIAAVSLSAAGAEEVLPSWKDPNTRKSIVSFVEKVTKEGSPGSSGKLKYEIKDGVSVLTKLPEIDLIDDKEGKPVGVQFYSENNDTDYQNGIVSDLEATVIQRFPNGMGIGLIGSWIEQLSDDDGATADNLNGFSGRAFGVGPIVTYTKKFADSQLDLTARWIHEFEVEKRFSGDVFAFSVGYKF